ncbi:preprotein translocase subunit YajC [Hathewaya histolytica]|uniref:Preprotein translocase subunit YajC n=1 Tax=Hathewaya histolytica TaxID=1498 RepID=A0A4U9RKI8_HATHI|nr:preprotein translocase subunit YajC [Hathewaya histolytica]VTQ92505.1 preprotein translocase subunit YajC [Hathewaya histolytica]
MKGLGGMLPLLIAMVAFYAMVFIPESKRKKKYNQMLKDVKVNDDILTKGGIMGRIINIEDEYIILESGPSRARIKLHKNGISSVLYSREEVEVKENKIEE